MELNKFLKLEYEPLKLLLFNSELVVRSSDVIKCFNEINSLNFNRKSNHRWVFNPSEIFSMFFTVRSIRVVCDQNGNLIENIKLKEDSDHYGK